ncbi:MAG TPA: hypothetical protein VK440_03430 [Burkholderiales bacterium]|nr:hypothetical protein [Burkholderiales bacterium]
MTVKKIPILEECDVDSSLVTTRSGMSAAASGEFHTPHRKT